MSSMLGERCRQPRECDLHGGVMEGLRDRIELRRLQRSKAAEGEEGDVRDALRGEVLDESVVVAFGEVVLVLDADDVCDLLSGGELRGVHVGHAEVGDEALLLQFGERGQWLLDGDLGTEDAQVDDVEALEAKIAQVVVGAVDEILPGQSRIPGAVGAALRTQFADDDEAVR